MALQAVNSSSLQNLTGSLYSPEYFGTSSDLKPVTRTTVRSSQRKGRPPMLQICARKADGSEVIQPSDAAPSKSHKHCMSAMRKAAMIGYVAALTVGQLAGSSHGADAQASGSPMEAATEMSEQVAQRGSNLSETGTSLQNEYTTRIAAASKDAAGSATSVFDQILNTVQQGSETVASALKDGVESAATISSK